MAVGLAEEFDTAGGIEFLQEVDDLGRMEFQLLETYAGERNGNLEELSVLACHRDEGVEGRHITALCDVGDGALVLIVVVVVVVATNVEETISFEMDNLVHLKVEAYCFHCCF